MSRAAAREAMKNYRDSGGITSAQTPSEAQQSVAADIERNKENTNTPVETLTPDDINPDTAQQQDTAPSGNDTRQQVVDAIGTGFEKSSELARRASDKIAAQRTPGGITAAVIVLFIIVFLLVPVDVSKQYTRAQLLVLSLLGHTRLIGRRIIGSIAPSPQPVNHGEGNPTDEYNADESIHTALYVESLASEPITIDAQTQLTGDSTGDIYENEVTSDEYWQSIDEIRHDGL